MGYGEKKKNNWGQGLSPKMFNGETYSRATACRGHNQNVSICTTHIKNELPDGISLFLEAK